LVLEVCPAHSDTW